MAGARAFSAREGAPNSQTQSDRARTGTRQRANMAIRVWGLLLLASSMFLHQQAAVAQTALLSALYMPPAQPQATSSSPGSSPSILKRDLSARQTAHEKVCQVSDGESVAILEIEESRGSDSSQSTRPAELPISGSTERGEIELRIESETHKYFTIRDKQLRLTRPLDRDAILAENASQQLSQPISSIYLQLSCTDKRASSAGSRAGHNRRLIIPVLVKVLDLNDNAPRFSQPVFTVQLDELTPVDTLVLGGPQLQAVDVDAASNALVEYSLRAGQTRSTPARARPTELPARLLPRARQSELEPEQTSAPAVESSTGSPTSEGPRASNSEPTFNLDSEPIVNGPMEDGEEEESDESLLAALNSTDPEPESESLARRRARRHLSPLSQPPPDSWTNLMGPSQAHLDEPRASVQDESSLDFFALELAPNGNWPLIKLKRPLDYERQRLHTLTLVATDGVPGSPERLSSTATIVVRVLDGDDQGPAFVLDQQGCATHSLAQSTPPGSANTEAPQLERLERTTKPGSFGAPRNFKVTDENFDFSDSPGLVELASARRNRRAISNKPDDFSCLTGAVGGGRAEYFASVIQGDSDYLLRVSPQAIRARDRDELNAPIRYSFVNATPANFSQYFHINPIDATIKQVAPVERAFSGQSFTSLIQAQEQSQNRLSSHALLTIEVIASDKNPPVLVPNSYTGFIEENAPIGSRVQSGSGALHIAVLDGERPFASRSFEFETTSEAFKVDKDGFLVVNKWPLDRDPPNQVVHMLQVTARQLGLPASSSGSSRALSSPISINVTLLDLNDNPPSIANSSLVPIQMAATSRSGARTRLLQVQVHDLDAGDNTRARFFIRHVSNGGRQRFEVDEQTGQLDALGKFQAGEQFSLTLQVEDELGRSSQGILELQVLPGPNTSAPQFLPAVEQPSATDAGQVAEASNRQVGYAVELSETVAPHSSVIQVRAVDPENEPISYAIVDGNINNDFYINSKTGLISVANKLDREEVRAYNLLVQARDSGGLATSRPVSITILDSNDQNPTFSKQHYEFEVAEGADKLGKVIGRVHASDGDAAENGLVSYRLEWPVGVESTRRPFELEERTGELRLVEALDFEQARSYSLVVSARDHGENPRSSLASVLVRVLDVQDEEPYFERPHIEARIAEDQAGRRVAQVQARDPDSEPFIRYRLRHGNQDLFEVDPQTGVVRTRAAGLDFEVAREHVLLVGLEGGRSLDESELAHWLELLSQTGNATGPARAPFCRVDVQVLDVNDHAPEFVVSQPLPVRVQDTAPLGTVIARLLAEDRDGTEQNNQVRYELVGRRETEDLVSTDTSDRCAQAFMVDSIDGSVAVKADLKRDSQSECQLVIRAHDVQPAGSRQLSSLASLTVFIDHMAETSGVSQIGFADSSFTVELSENSPANSLVKVLPVLNKPKTSFPLTCEIVSGNEQNHFVVDQTELRDCELRTRDGNLDFEQKQRYTLTIRLNTIGALQPAIGAGQQARALAQVHVNLLDRNDNRPQFSLPSRYAHLTQGRLLAAVANDAPSETNVLQLRATDLDKTASSNGLISYELLNELELDGRFRVESADGLVRTARPVEDLPPTRLPIRLRLLARDNPEVASETLESRVELIVNLIDDRHRVILSLKDSPSSRVLDNREELLGVLQERTGLISGLEKVESLKIQKPVNASGQSMALEADVGGTDFCFYLIEPGTFRIVPSDDQRIKSSLLEGRAQSLLADMLDQTLGLRAARVRLPYSLGAAPNGLGLSSRLASTRAGSFASLLIVIGVSIAIVSAIIVIYQCGSWSGYARTSAHNDKLAMAAGLGAFNRPSMSQFASNLHLLPSSFTCPKSGTTTLTTADSFALKGNATFQAPGSILGETRALHEQIDRQDMYYSAKDQATSQQAEDFGKEYETQMLKMSVLFDDNHSLDGHNLSRNLVNVTNLN